jgi:hypothetical protein
LLGADPRDGVLEPGRSFCWGALLCGEFPGLPNLRYPLSAAGCEGLVFCGAAF